MLAYYNIIDDIYIIITALITMLVVLLFSK